MKIITRQSCADEAVEKWERVYGNGEWGQDKLVILENLKKLPAPVDPDEIDRVIGNTSWTHAPSCGGCASRPEVVIEIGIEPDYESGKVWLCLSCIDKAARLAGTVYEEF